MGGHSGAAFSSPCMVFSADASFSRKGITLRGTVSSESMPKLKSVQQVIDEPFVADQSWMDSPLSKDKFFGWLMDMK
jgi:hypothetical protein